MYQSGGYSHIYYDPKSSICEYKKSLKLCINPVGDSSWLYKDSHFNGITFNCYQKDEGHSTYLKFYLKDVSTKFKEKYDKEQEVIQRKLKLTNDMWIQQFGSIPDRNKDKSQVKKYEKLIAKLKMKYPITVKAFPGSIHWNYFEQTMNLIYLRQTILFSVDIEAYEYDYEVVTEIGITIYDPRENLFSLTPTFRNFHICVSESFELRNGKFVPDFKDCYLLGESMVIPLQECINFLQSLINYYMRIKTEEDRTWKRAFVGHNISGDLKWLKGLGIKLPDDLDYDLNNNDRVKVVDTQTLFISLYGNRGSSLGNILRILNIPHSYLHNAGNDAYFTLQSLFYMCDIGKRNQMCLDDLDIVQSWINKWLEYDKRINRYKKVNTSFSGLRYHNYNIQRLFGIDNAK